MSGSAIISYPQDGRTVSAGVHLKVMAVVAVYSVSVNDSVLVTAYRKRPRRLGASLVGD